MTTYLFSRMAHTLSTGLASGVDRPRDDEALYAWVVDHLGVRLPRAACCPEHVAPFEAFAAAYFAGSPIAVWNRESQHWRATFPCRARAR